MVGRAASSIIAFALAVASFAQAQPAGPAISLRGQVAGAALESGGIWYLPLQESTAQGLTVHGDAHQFQDLQAGDWLEINGRLINGSVTVDTIRHLVHETPVPLHDIPVNGILRRDVGLWLRVTGTITGFLERGGAHILALSEQGFTANVLLPRAVTNPLDSSKYRVGDRLRVSGLIVEVPAEGGASIVVRSVNDLQLVQTGSMLPAALLLSSLIAIALLLGVWWMRERRLSEQHRALRAFHALSEEIIASAAPTDIAAKLVRVLPTFTQATGVRLYIFNRRVRSLERVPTHADPEPVAVPVDNAREGLEGGAVVCLRNRSLLNIPDVRRSPVLDPGARKKLPRSAMFVPLFAQNEVLGVMEVVNARRRGFFTVEEQAAAQHLANQVAAALKLQEQQVMREQLFRSEKLAATGQLISGVASELRAPLDAILQLSASLAGFEGRPAPLRELRQLSAESHRAAEIVSRLVSFARPQDAEPRMVDATSIMNGLIQFREPEWKTLGLRVQNRLGPEPAMVLGVQGQLEQVFLNLLVHAEQCAEGSPKSIVVASSLLAGRMIFEITYSSPNACENDEMSADNTAVGLAASQGILLNHGGELRFRSLNGGARFEVELPVAESKQEERYPVGDGHGRALTALLVDNDPGSQRQLLGMLSARGHRVVPVTPEEAGDLAQRLRFDMVIWVMRPSGPRWSEMQDRVRQLTPGFVLLAEAYDAGLALSIEDSGGFLLARPVMDADLDRILREIESRLPDALVARK